MAETHTDKTLADYLAIAVGPLLIMALVGSLVFFLLEVLYVGQYHGQLQWILFFFVFGAVLIARISMTSGIADRAGVYGVVLGGLVWVALLIYVEYPPESEVGRFGWAINLALIALIWWSAHRLTWDCTLIDDTVDASGAGLLEVAGLEQGSQPQGDEGAADEPTAGRKKRKEPSGLSGWWQRFRKYRTEQQRRPHAPGVWVVYFSLAALPLFGLGQILMSANRTQGEAQRAGSQRYAFFLMTVYVGSGLGLLLTTSFLGLRRYLRQRGVRMPGAVTGVWLLLGGLLAGGLLLAGGVLPRPGVDARNLLEWTGLVGSPDREASEWAKEEGEGAGKDKGTGARGKQSGKGEQKGEGRDGKGREKADKGSGSDSKSRDGGGKAQGKQGQKGGREEKNAKAGQKGDKGRAGGKDKNADKKDEKKGEQRQDQAGQQPQSSPPPPPEVSEDMVTLLKWIVGIVIAVVVLVMLLRAGLGWLANFTSWAKRLLDSLRALWASLWGGKRAAGPGESEAPPPPKPRAFASFHDPFLTGEAAGMSAEALVRYSFEALESWAVERKLARQTGETALEFAERLGGEFPVLEADVRRLADLVAGLAYAPHGVPSECREDLRQFWQVLVDAVERPLSAGVGG
jgi:hypothetical protein